jgi:hypothetical protein
MKPTFFTFLQMGYLLSLRPSSALLDKHEKAANTRQADSESQKASPLVRYCENFRLSVLFRIKAAKAKTALSGDSSPNEQETSGAGEELDESFCV